ncbi:hypothetical protein ASG73_12170 [Janibacter sp. Soil728]|uniref:hypothetical protein n=1 Tax=Janibacter sp. Soil728 TaxID=1736393 RepID=UPI0006F8F7C6|nr:hypothetical protein [Janibacter sp. Soil728]KRE37054.1 hypothetical protein ASG73_12170 [Janibacter sp. Soil728]
MKLYADLPARRTGQIVADLLMLGWILLWAWVGTVVHATTLKLGEPGHRLESAGQGFRDKLTTAGDNVDDLPLLDDKVAKPFRDAAGAGSSIEDAGRDLVSAVDTLATTLGWVTALTPILIVGAFWLASRWRFVRRATAAQALVGSVDDLDLFALRAMANQPLQRLARISDDPTGAWRRGDSEVIRELALLELSDCGLRPPEPTISAD